MDTTKKRLQHQYHSLLILLARPARLERATCGFVVDFFSEAISHHFQRLKYQPLTRAKLEQVGLFWIILGLDSYTLVTLEIPAPTKLILLGHTS